MFKKFHKENFSLDTLRQPIRSNLVSLHIRIMLSLGSGSERFRDNFNRGKLSGIDVFRETHATYNQSNSELTAHPNSLVRAFVQVSKVPLDLPFSIAIG